VLVGSKFGGFDFSFIRVMQGVLVKRKLGGFDFSF